MEEIVKIARAFAYAAHAEQKYGELKYITHLDHAHDVAVRFGMKASDILAAVYLHDTLEDTKITDQDLAYIFGPDIANLVWRVTDEPGKNRKERHEKTFPKVRAGGYPAVVVKLCDRIANVETSARGPNKSKFAMYRKEYPEFRDALYVKQFGTNFNAGIRMWDHLDTLLEYPRKA
jgi:guanosine-3',5'-bis(diphosphate) 3'-pyrophosphohydrolase